MSAYEFKTWFQGFVAAMECTSPSEEQWNAIKEKVANLTDQPIFVGLHGGGPLIAKPRENAPNVGPYVVSAP
jgi:hypothetical protein